MNNNKGTLVKEASQIKALREAGAISSKLHLLAMSLSVVGQSERQLHNKILDYFKHSGATGWAYPGIVGSGHGSTILHAKPTLKKMKEQELVLLDLGVKFAGYCSDITRTWPAGTKFSKEQKTIYEIVLKAQLEVIKNIKPGNDLVTLHQTACDSLTEGLLRKGVMKKVDIKKVFPHKTSHWIGSKVHDNCPYLDKDGQPIKLSAGMCFTVEPGLYFGSSFKTSYSAIGVRIEDVVLVTENGYELLTHVPKEIEEIENIRFLRNE